VSINLDQALRRAVRDSPKAHRKLALLVAIVGFRDANELASRCSTSKFDCGAHSPKQRFYFVDVDILLDDWVLHETRERRNGKPDGLVLDLLGHAEDDFGLGR